MTQEKKLMTDKIAIFDLDGTLLNTLGDLAHAANETLKTFGLPTHPVEAYKHFIGRGRTNLIRNCSGLTDEAQIEELCKVNDRLYGECYRDRTAAYPGVRESLEAIQAAGIPMAVLSNKNHDMTCRLVEECLEGIRFVAVFGKRPGHPLKPDPASVFEILDTAGIAPARCIYFGDSGVDMQTACAAGCYPVGVTWGFRDEQELLAGGAEKILHSAVEIAETVKAFLET
ncbi:MAG: HAD family hydrolase [Clostridia bacterium]|nr:HAD family hydrolase [Clostridia bacterium]